MLRTQPRPLAAPRTLNTLVSRARALPTAPESRPGACPLAVSRGFCVAWSRGHDVTKRRNGPAGPPLSLPPRWACGGPGRDVAVQPRSPGRVAAPVTGTRLLGDRRVSCKTNKQTKNRPKGSSAHVRLRPPSIEELNSPPEAPGVGSPRGAARAGKATRADQGAEPRMET